MDTLLEGRKPSIFDLYQQYKFDTSELARRTGIAELTIRLMLGYSPVKRNVAYKVLSELSTQLHHDYTFENIDIPLIPTFSQTLETLNIVPSDLAENAGVTQNTVQLMIANKPVFQDYAEKALSALSAMAQQDYNLENVDVNLMMVAVEGSEVARLKREIEETYAAAKRGLEGLSEGSSKHKTITTRMEKMTDHIQTLEGLVGEKETMQFMEQLGD